MKNWTGNLPIFVAYMLRFVAISYRSLFSRLPNLYQKLGRSKNVELKRLYFKLMKDCKLNAGEIIEENYTTENSAIKKKEIYRLNTDLLCAKENSLTFITQYDNNAVLEIQKL